MNIILKPKILHYTKETAKVIAIMVTGFLLSLAIIFFKYKPVYEVTVAGEKLGYILNLKEFKNVIEEEVINCEKEHAEDISFIEMPKYQMKLLVRTSNSNEQEILEKLKKDDIVVTYKYYEISLNNETKSCVKTLEEAEKIVNEIKSEISGDTLELNIQINEKYTQSSEEINTASLESAETVAKTVANELKEESKVLAVVNDVKLSVLPVNGRLTSRYGESSSRRRAKHTGLDIACTTGTDIKAVSKGIVICASKQGSYGNIVKVNHGNGIETWYAHCSKIYTKVGKEVSAGDIIAAVGSTGNSTGPHLHFEIRINGATVNPQSYIY